MAQRFPVIPPSDRNADQRALVDTYVAGWRKVLVQPDGRLGGPLEVTMHQPGFARAIMVMSDHIRSEVQVSARAKELIILVVARHVRCDFEWCAHVGIARQIGIPDAVIRAIAEQRTPDFDSDEDRTIHAIAAQLTTRANLDDATYAAGVALFGTGGMVDVIGMAGYYMQIALLMNVAGVRHPQADALDISMS